MLLVRRPWPQGWLARKRRAVFGVSMSLGHIWDIPAPCCSATTYSLEPCADYRFNPVAEHTAHTPGVTVTFACSLPPWHASPGLGQLKLRFPMHDLVKCGCVCSDVEGWTVLLDSIRRTKPQLVTFCVGSAPVLRGMCRPSWTLEARTLTWVCIVPRSEGCCVGGEVSGCRYQLEVQGYCIVLCGVFCAMMAQAGVL